MINYTTAIVNNKFEVTFDFTPDDVRYSRNNYTAVHRASGRTDRQGVWEGIECIEAKIKVDGVWKSYSLPPNKKVVVTVGHNNAQIQAYGVYRIKTMGFHWLDTTGTYPFFWYGNIGGNPNRYRFGHFTDGRPSPPDVNFKNINALVPPDWNYETAEWTDWAYNHAQATGNYAISNGRYEQRNGNYESANSRNGWLSDSNRAQMWRKACRFWFKKEFYTNTFYSSGIAVNPNAPELEIYPAKGDGGQVKLTYRDPSGSPGHVKLAVYCADRTAIQDDFHVSGEFPNGGSYTYNIDFNRLFGESYRANDVYYEAWSKNSYGYISPSTGRRGVQRYNGRPSIPTGLTAYNDDNLIYNTVKFKWNKSYDPDGDYVVYDLWLKVIDKEGNVIKNDFISRGFNGLIYTLNIANYPDGSNMEIKVRASDNLITSDWCPVVKFKKGSKPTNIINLIAPIKINNNIYHECPRFYFEGYDGESDISILFNGSNYTLENNPQLFDTSKTHFVFKPTKNMMKDNIYILGFLKNPYGESRHTMQYTFKYLPATEKIEEGEHIIAYVINDLQNSIIDLCKAYQKKHDITIINKKDKLSLNVFNDLYNTIHSLNEYLNNIIPNSKFNYTMESRPANLHQVNDDLLWETLVKDIAKM